MDLRQIPRRRVWSLSQMSLKIEVNFGGLHAVYFWKDIFALVDVCVVCSWLGDRFV